jgi:hypothetical protein
MGCRQHAHGNMPVAARLPLPGVGVQQRASAVLLQQAGGPAALLVHNVPGALWCGSAAEHCWCNGLAVQCVGVQSAMCIGLTAAQLGAPGGRSWCILSAHACFKAMMVRACATRIGMSSARAGQWQLAGSGRGRAPAGTPGHEIRHAAHDAARMDSGIEAELQAPYLVNEQRRL